MASPNADGTSGAPNSSPLTTLLARLDRTKIPHFHKVMTKTAVTQRMHGPLAYALGFPTRFVRVHRGLNFSELAHFQLASSKCKQTWRIKLTVKVDPEEKLEEVSAYGRGGWKAFVEDNDIRVGDTLVFSLVGSLSLAVDIVNASRARAELDHQLEEEEDPRPLLGISSLNPKNSDVEETSFPCKRRRKSVPSQSHLS